jgi:nucleoside-diphosphate-sugar epimerase
MDFVVTGGTGFIGSTLVRRLTGQGHHVLLLTRRAGAHPFTVAGANCSFDGREDAEGVTTCTYPAGDYEGLSAALPDSPRRVDGVFHLAANLKYLGKREASYADNVVFTQRLLEWSRARGAGFFAFTSSIEAMGPSPTNGAPLGEADECRPVSTYGRTKLAAERWVAEYGRAPGLRTVSFRLGNVYGPGTRFLVVDVARAIKEGRTNPLVRYYHQVKDALLCPCHVDDIVDGILCARQGGYRSGDVFILAGRETLRAADLFADAAAALGKAFEPPRDSRWAAALVGVRSFVQLHLKRRADRVTYLRLGHWSFDSRRAREVLGFAPRVPWNRGLVETIGWAEAVGALPR